MYHNSFTQTDQTATYHAEKFTREVQTYQYKTKSTVMNREFGVQMEKAELPENFIAAKGLKGLIRTHLYIDNRQDQIVHPQPYFSSEMW